VHSADGEVAETEARLSPRQVQADTVMTQSQHTARLRELRKLMDLTPGEEQEVDCAIKRRVDYGEDLVVIDLPRTCLDSPPWVRVGVVSTAALADERERGASTMHFGPATTSMTQKTFRHVSMPALVSCPFQNVAEWRRLPCGSTHPARRPRIDAHRERMDRGCRCGLERHRG
jgi:hypothetical protein